MTVAIFGSARCSPLSKEYQHAVKLGGLLASGGHVVCNGGYGGIMEATARGARESGGSTIGVTVETFSRQANAWIEREVRMPTLASRLFRLVELGEAYIILRGGTGTLLEFAAVWEFINKKEMPPKPVVADEFWRPVVELIGRELQSEGADGAGITLASTPADMLNALGKR